MPRAIVVGTPTKGTIRLSGLRQNEDAFYFPLFVTFQVLTKSDRSI